MGNFELGCHPSPLRETKDRRIFSEREKNERKREGERRRVGERKGASSAAIRGTGGERTTSALRER